MQLATNESMQQEMLTQCSNTSSFFQQASCGFSSTKWQDEATFLWRALGGEGAYDAGVSLYPLP